MESHTAFWRWRWTGRAAAALERSGLRLPAPLPVPMLRYTPLHRAGRLHLNQTPLVVASVQARKTHRERESCTRGAAGRTIEYLEPVHRCRRLTATASMADAARLFLLVAVTAALAGRSDAAWCVCRTDLADTALQKTLDYACGGGADCKPILQNGACFAPDTVKAHCSYAVNSFYQRNNQNPQACVFSGTATLSNNDPSGNGCTYPATPSLKTSYYQPNLQLAVTTGVTSGAKVPSMT
ncbi:PLASMODESMATA CALLOSE-BINDING PROTEIN 1 isoform X2 [Sorghum bicolor]|uniref:X8 domain-containing protein n=1 Tax=Sorghum bicolor TaxID=4558 RepID=A0A1Z5S4T9_SORBI|nr:PLASMODESMATA CALLOSE-BINDING PROTEIN 1 isoform X2 [Sorghum bicolor]OQU90963.1 hypothetical protein SORBI_3001G085200 [Sorghum bicolor]|eukprot:XP_021317086.1 PLASMODESMATA CALLOSE-BINDING PROTEIN 1 isoform X2 [Sorghum bicolor]